LAVLLSLQELDAIKHTVFHRKTEHRRMVHATVECCRSMPRFPLFSTFPVFPDGVGLHKALRRSCMTDG